MQCRPQTNAISVSFRLTYLFAIIIITSNFFYLPSNLFFLWSLHCRKIEKECTHLAKNVLSSKKLFSIFSVDAAKLKRSKVKGTKYSEVPARFSLSNFSGFKQAKRRFSASLVFQKSEWGTDKRRSFFWRNLKKALSNNW